MASRVFGIAACLAFQVCYSTADEKEVVGSRTRQFSDEVVLSSQRAYPAALKSNLDKKLSWVISNSYLEGSSLRIALGPAAGEMNSLLGWSDPLIIRGKCAIANFWDDAVQAGLSQWRAYEDTGAYASTSFVVDDSTVIVEGAFSSNVWQGHVLSETWIRDGLEWKIWSQMLRIDHSDAGVLVKPPTESRLEKAIDCPLPVGVAPAPEASTETSPTATSAAEEQAKRLAKKGEDGIGAMIAKDVNVMADNFKEKVGIKNDDQVPSAKPEELSDNDIVKAEGVDDIKRDRHSEESHLFLIGAVACIAVLVLIFVFARRHAQKRQQVQVGLGFDAMLG